jgi:hypothetical protein
MKMRDAGAAASRAVGSRHSITSNPQRRSIAYQLANVRKYHGAGSLKSGLNPAQLPVRQPS